MARRNIFSFVRRAISRRRTTPTPTPPKKVTTQSLPTGTAVGTGIRGGILVTTSGGGVKEVFQDRPDQPLDPSRARAISRGVGGPGAPPVTTPIPSQKPTKVIKEEVVEIKAPSDTIVKSANQQRLLQRRLRKFEQQRREAALKRPPGVISPTEKEKGIARVSQKLRTERGILRTKKLRGEKLSPKEEAKLATLAGFSVVAESGEAVTQLPKAFVNIIKNPKVLKELPGAIKESSAEFGELIRVSPGEALVVAGTNIILLKGSSKVISSLSKGVTKGTTKLSTKFVGEATKGKTLKIPTETGKTIDLKVVGKIPKQTLQKQVSLAGKRTTAISTQADRLVTILKSTKQIRKPIAGEANFNKQTKKLLSKFDRRTINKKELITLDNLIKRQGAKGLLERSFFADPSGKIRPSRLGLFKEKIKLSKFEKKRVRTLEKRKKLTTKQQVELTSLKERQPFTVESIVEKLTTDVTFKQAKPQILLFEDIKIAKLPKSLSSVKKKLSTGGTLTKKETDDLLTFQLKKSSKFKPIGFHSKEAEITLSPGEIIKKVKTVGVTIVDGRRIPIIKTQVFKPKGEIKKLINRFQKGKKPLSLKEQKRLDKLLKRETGFDYGIKSSSSAKVAKKFVSIKRIGLSSLSKVKLRKAKPSIAFKPSRRRPSKPSPRRPSKPSRGRPSKPSKVKVRKTPSRISPKPSPKPRRKPPVKPPIKPPIRPKTKPPIRPPFVPKKVRKLKRKRKPQQAFNVRARPRRIKGKKRPKLIKINQVPLSKRNAKNLRNKVLDSSLARTGRISPTKGKPKRPLLKVNKNFAKQSKRKFRDFKIVKGKRKPLRKGKVIERSKFLLDTRSEKRSITLAKKVAELRKQARKPQPKRTLSPKQLKALSNGRKTRLNNLKKKR